MNKLIKYNLEIMTGIFAVVLAASLSQWTELSMLRRMIVVFMVLYTLHEWEESKYPGGFYRIFFSKCYFICFFCFISISWSNYINVWNTS